MKQLPLLVAVLFVLAACGKDKPKAAAIALDAGAGPALQQDDALAADLLIDDVPAEALRSRQPRVARWRWQPAAPPRAATAPAPAIATTVAAWRSLAVAARVAAK